MTGNRIMTRDCTRREYLGSLSARSRRIFIATYPFFPVNQAIIAPVTPLNRIFHGGWIVTSVIPRAEPPPVFFLPFNRPPTTLVVKRTIVPWKKACLTSGQTMRQAGSRVRVKKFTPGLDPHVFLEFPRSFPREISFVSSSRGIFFSFFSFFFFTERFSFLFISTFLFFSFLLFLILDPVNGWSNIPCSFRREREREKATLAAQRTKRRLRTYFWWFCGCDVGVCPLQESGTKR